MIKPAQSGAAGKILPERRPAKPMPPEDGLMLDRAKQASEFLKALAHESRLLILCLLCEGKKSVTDLEELLSMRQPAVSQHLARLRHDGLVETAREGRIVYYTLANEDTRKILSAVHEVFCARHKRGAG